MAYYVDWLDAQQDVQTLWTGRLESRLARHWPELTGLLSLNSVTLLKILIHYGGPTLLAEDAEAAKKLAGWGRHVLATKKIEKILRSAKETAGVKQNEQDVARIRQYANEALEAHREIQKARKELIELAKENDVIRRQAEAVGVVTACVLWAALGDPRNYHCAEAYRKAMGLNLKERSSGKYQGKLSCNAEKTKSHKHTSLGCGGFYRVCQKRVTTALQGDGQGAWRYGSDVPERAEPRSTAQSSFPKTRTATVFIWGTPPNPRFDLFKTYPKT
jgi:hypothetical protein